MNILKLNNFISCAFQRFLRFQVVCEVFESSLRRIISTWIIYNFSISFKLALYSDKLKRPLQFPGEQANLLIPGTRVGWYDEYFATMTTYTGFNFKSGDIEICLSLHFCSLLCPPEIWCMKRIRTKIILLISDNKLTSDKQFLLVNTYKGWI